MRIGKITVGALDEWSLSPGSVTSWHPTAAAAEKARQAPVSSVPVSYMQGQHLRNYCERTAAGLNFSRQIIASCDVAGQCDISAMDHAVNAYLRRHDTFRSWFEQTEDGEFIRHAINDPADIEFVPVDHGDMTVDEIHAHVVAIPNPLEWGCFTFGIIQNEDHFTFFAAMDHVHGDATLIGTTMMEANGMYSALSGGGAGAHASRCRQLRRLLCPRARVHVEVDCGFARGAGVDRLRRGTTAAAFPNSRFRSATRWSRPAAA